MPELPEVETTCRGIAPWVEGASVQAVVVRERRLRWPVPAALETAITGARVCQVTRRAKYVLLQTTRGTVIIHLGMSGSLRVLNPDTPAQRHDHVDIVFDNARLLRLHDPRRFGAVLFSADGHHPRLDALGPEPLSSAFDGAYLHRRAHGRRVAVKVFIMNSHIVVGVGNIYASEALFVAGIHPKRAAGRISKARFHRLAEAIQHVLRAAIAAGGTTLRDFVASDGKPGYFSQQLRVYARDGEPCPSCGRSISRIVMGQRASYYCRHCQR